MRLYWLVLCLVFLVACQQAQIEKPSLCNSPYFEWQQGQCCLDSNSNQVCDDHEAARIPVAEEKVKPSVDEVAIPETEPVKEPSETPKALMQELISKAPTSYFFWNWDDNAGALVVGDKRSDG